MCPTVSLPLGRKREPHTFVPDVPSSVNVAVMGATAQGARPLPNRQVLGSREAVAALMTELARREQPTDGDETLAPVFELVAENGVNKLVQDAIRNQQSRQYDQCSGESPG